MKKPTIEPIKGEYLAAMNEAFKCLDSCPKINAFETQIWTDSKKMIRLETFSVANGIRFDPGELRRHPSPTFEDALDRMKQYVDWMLEHFFVWVRVMPELTISNNGYVIYARFARISKANDIPRFTGKENL